MKNDSRIMCAYSAKEEKGTVLFLRSSKTLRSFLKKTGLFILGIGLTVNVCADLLAQSNSANSPQNFLSRLKPNFTGSGNAQNPVPTAPGAFSELNPTAEQNLSTDNRGWVNIGTDYSTPATGLKPDSTSNKFAEPQARSFNPGTRGNVNASPFSQRPESRTAQSGTTATVPTAQMVPTASGNTASDLPKLTPVDQRVFHLPIENFLSIIPQNQLKEIRLYVSRDNGQNWSSYQTLNQSQIEKLPSKNLGVKTASDGEFWFALRIVDQNGNEFPQNSTQPTWRILVNSTGKPLYSLMNQPTENQTASVPGASGNSAKTNASNNGGLIPRPQWGPTPDENPAIGSANASNAANGSVNPAQSPNIAVYSVKDRGVNSIPDISLPVYKIQNSNPMEAFQKFAENSRGKKSRQSAKPQYSDSETLPGDTGSSADAGLDLENDSAAGASDSEFTLDDSPLEADLNSNREKGSGNEDLFLLGNDSAVNEEGLNSKIRFMNQPNLSIEYDVSSVGSSGVGRVELWSTLDDGMTWTYLAEDEDCVSPIQVALKSDGKYGFQILVFNGAGVGMERPQPGSAPQMEVVLDRIAPRVQIYSIQLQAEFGDLEIHWGAEDANFGSNPVLLSWASSTEGPWRSMTSMPLENTGRFTWRIPDGIPGKVFIRLDVCDQAQNAATLVTGPVVTDIVRPTGVILDAKPR